MRRREKRRGGTMAQRVKKWHTLRWRELKKVLKAQHWSVVTSLFTIIRMPSEEQTVLRIRLGQFVSKYTVCGYSFYQKMEIHF